jgi:hypothetical protein
MALLRDHLKKAGVICVGPFIFPHHHFSVQTAKWVTAVKVPGCWNSKD